jgi:hypothetical protein
MMSRDGKVHGAPDHAFNFKRARPLNATSQTVLPLSRPELYAEDA